MGNKNIRELASQFKKYTSYEIDSYLKSLPYFLLTGRKGFYFFRGMDTSLTVVAHPHRDNTLLVFPEYDGDGTLTVELLKRFADKGARVQLARYTDADYAKLQQAIQKDKTDLVRSIAIKAEDVMDWKYPARILDTCKVAALSGGSFTNIRNKFNKVAKNTDFEIIPLSDERALGLISSSIFHWLAGLAYIGRNTDENVTDFYNQLLKTMRDFPAFFDGFIIEGEKESLGFTVWDVTGDTANALAGLNQRSVPGLSEFQVVKACDILSKKGIKRYNLGGSETENLDKFKLKFHPIDSLELATYDVYYEDALGSKANLIDVYGHNGIQMNENRLEFPAV